MATIRLRLFLAGMLLALSAGSLFAQREATGPRPRRGVRAPADASVRPSQAPTAKPRTEPPRQADDAAPPATVRGAVRGPAGEPASGATVWLVVRDGEKFAEPIATSTGDNGQFSFPNVDDHTLPDDDARSAVLVARDAEGRLGWLYLNRARFNRAPNEIALTEVAEITGRVVDAEGRPVAGARLKPRSVYVSRALAERVAAARNDRPNFFANLADQYQATTAADGTFKLLRMPRDSGIVIEVSAPGIDKLRVVLDSGRPATLRLARPGSVAGRVAVADGDLAAAEGLQLQIDLQIDEVKRGVAPIYYRDTTAVDKTGAFRFEGLPPGRYVISSVERQNVPLFAEPSPPVEVAAGEQVTELTLPLKKARLLHGSVIDAQTGVGVEGVEMTINSWSDARIIESRIVNTDADGHFSAWLKPGKCDARATRVPEQYLPPAQTSAPRETPRDEWPTISLTRGLQIQGIVVDESGNPAPRAEIMLSGSRTFRFPTTHRSDQSGKFTLAQIDPAEALGVRARTATRSSDADLVLPAPLTDDPVTIVVARDKACWVSGQVVDERGEPLVHARVSVTVTHQFTSRGSSMAGAELLPVAADGSFESEALWPGDDFQLEVRLQGFGTLTTGSVIGEPGMIYDFGPLTLQRTVDVEVAVVDDAGHGVPHATLHVMVPLDPRFLRAPNKFLSKFDTNDDGRYVITGVDPAATLSVWARSATAASRGAQVAWGPQLNAPMRIVLSDKLASRLSGSVIGRDGAPVQNAKVAVLWDRRAGERTVGFRRSGWRRQVVYDSVDLGNCVVEADGAFRTAPVWPDEHYHLIVTAEGFEAVESPTMLAAAAETIDLGRLSPRKNDLVIEGRVIDAAGKAVEDATVVNSGDAREPLQATTDADGRFRLEGLFEGAVYALVRKPGYRAAGLRCVAGDHDALTRLVSDKRPDEAPAGGSNSVLQLARKPSDEESRLAVRLLSELWKLRDHIADEPESGGSRSEEASKLRLIRCLAKIDPALALQWSAAEGGRFDDDVRLAAVKRVAEDDVDAAIVLLSGIHTTQAGWALQAIAWQHQRAGAVDEAARLFAAAKAPGRTGGRASGGRWGGQWVAEPQVDARVVKARAGMAAIDAGQFERGRELIEEAADGLDQTDESNRSGEPHATVARALVAINPKRATRLWQTHIGSGKASDKFYASIDETLLAMAPTDIRETRTLLRLFEQWTTGSRMGRTSDQLRMQIAYKIAPDQTAAALALLDEIGMGGIWNDVTVKADALGWVATAIASRDPPQAARLIDSAFDLYLSKPPRSGVVWRTGGPPVEAARLALHAQACGYADMRGVVDRVLALRLTPGSETRDRAAVAAAQVESTVATARLLALVDRGVARELLLSAEPHARLIGGSGNPVDHGLWLQAWALTDLERAEELFNQELAVQGPRAYPEIIESGLLPMLELLAEPPADRARFILNGDPYRQSYFWFPAE